MARPGRAGRGGCAEGLVLAPRLPIYPRHEALTTWVDTEGGPASLAAAVRRGADGFGLARGSGWRPGGGGGSRWLPPAEVVAAAPTAALPHQPPAATPAATHPLPAAAPTHALRWRVAVDARGVLPGASVPLRRRSLAATLTATAAGTHRLTLAEATAALSARGGDAAAVEAG